MLLPEGVKIISFKMNQDERGMLAEVHRVEWQTSFEPLQWNLVHSNANVLRGVHLHYQHADYLIVTHGHMVLCLHDVRPGASPGNSAKLDLIADQLCAVIIPPGVAHGFYFPVASSHFYSVSHYWNIADELGCRWNSEELQMQWPVTNPLLSPRDATAGPYQDMVLQFQQKFIGLK